MDRGTCNTREPRPKRWGVRLFLLLALLLLVILAGRPCDPPGDPSPAECEPGKPCPVDAPTRPPQAEARG